MSAPRFFVAPEDGRLQADVELELPDRVARHAIQVLRLRAGDSLVLFDGTGGEYAGTLIDAGRRARARTAAHRPIEREPPVAITLVQAVVAADVMDGIVRKAVELGAFALQPVLAERSQRGPAERTDRRVEKWRQIAIAACEQCGRNRIPAVAAVLPLSDWLRVQDEPGAVAVLHPGATASLAAAANAVRALLVGPEGGLTDDELEVATAAGARAVHLGPRILRADTAALAGLATLNAGAGDAR